jgi:hypothetical protein
MIVALLVAQATAGQALASAPAAATTTVATPDRSGSSYGPPAPVKPKPPLPIVSSAADRCPRSADPSGTEIVVCAPKVQPYRIDPDILAGKKAYRHSRRSAQATPPYRGRDRSCAVVGPAGCIAAAAGVNLLATIAVIGEIGERLSKGQEIGSIFKTTPEMDEYQYYLAAKKEREAKEAEARVKAAKAAAAAVAASKPAGEAQPAEKPAGTEKAPSASPK